MSEQVWNPLRQDSSGKKSAGALAVGKRIVQSILGRFSLHSDDIGNRPEFLIAIGFPKSCFIAAHLAECFLGMTQIKGSFWSAFQIHCIVDIQRKSLDDLNEIPNGPGSPTVAEIKSSHPCRPQWRRYSNILPAVPNDFSDCNRSCESPEQSYDIGFSVLPIFGRSDL